MPEPAQFAVRPIGVVRSTLTELAGAPKQADEDAPAARLVFDDAVVPALDGLVPGAGIVVLTWLDRADRAALTTHPRGDPSRGVVGVFASRSPHRPNPIGLHTVTVTAVEGHEVTVDGLEALDGTPVLDVKTVLVAIDER